MIWPTALMGKPRAPSSSTITGITRPTGNHLIALVAQAVRRLLQHVATLSAVDSRTAIGQTDIGSMRVVRSVLSVAAAAALCIPCPRPGRRWAEAAS